MLKRNLHKKSPAVFESLEGRQLFAVALVSQSTAGMPADGVGAGSIASQAINSSISDDGRFVVFVSEASNLVTGDTNGAADLFVRDRARNTTTLVSAAPDGTAGNGKSGDPGEIRGGFAISGNGRYVVFASNATNLVSGKTDSNNLPDYFLRDLQTATTSLVTATPAGDYSTSTTIAGTIGRPAISDDGRFIAFTSVYSDLDSAVNDADQNAADVFVRDTTAGTTKQLSKTLSGAAGFGAVSPSPTISSNGQYIAFTSNDVLATSPSQFIFEQVWIYDTSASSVSVASIAADGVTFADGDCALPTISGDGRSVAFLSGARNLVNSFVDNNGEGLGEAGDLYLRNLNTNATQLITHAASSTTAGGNSADFAPSLSANGRFVAYVSRSKNLVTTTDNNDNFGITGGEDVFYFDATTGQTTLLSINAGGTAAGALPSIDASADIDRSPAMSDDGRYVVFVSSANDLVASDENSLPEAFVRDTQSNTTRRLYDGLSLSTGGDIIASATSPAISGNGVAITFNGDGAGIIGASDLAEEVFVDGTPPDVIVDPPALGPLAPTLFTELPMSAVSGGKVKGAAAIVSITNTDAAAYNNNVTITLYASTNDSLDTTADTQVAKLTKRLKLKSAQARSFRIKIPSFPTVADGDYLLIAQVTSPVVDPGVSTDNEFIHLAAPFVDLSGTFGATPESITRGKRGRLSITVNNAGNVDSKGTVPVTIAVSPNADGSGATTVATVNAKLAIKPSASKNVRLSFALPAEAPAGALFFVATLGSPTMPPGEPNVTNNTLLSSAAINVI